MVKSQNNQWLVLPFQDVLILVKTQCTSYIILFGVVTSNSDVMPLFMFPRDLTQHGGLHQVPGGGSNALDWEDWPLEDSTSINKDMHHTIQAGEVSLDCQKIFATTSPLTCGLLIPQIVIPLIFIYGAQLSERPTKFCVPPKMNWRQG